MAPFIVLTASFLIFFLAGLAGVEYFNRWEMALRWALALMFIFTGMAHFTRTRGDLIRMVPPVFPRPELLVTITGILEIIGAVGLMIPSLAAPAAWGLILLLVAMFPANAYAARQGLPVAGRTAMPLIPRLLLQLLWITLLWLVSHPLTTSVSS